jgi:hypothetical protein
MEILPIILIIGSVAIAIWENIVLYTYLILTENKTYHENIACGYITIKFILNILYAIYIYHTDFLKKENKNWDKLKSIIIAVNICGVILYSDINMYGIFIPVITVEFIIFMVILSSIVLIVLLLLFSVLLFGKKQNVTTRQSITIEYPIIIIEVPQLATPATIELHNSNIPQATLVTIRQGTTI